jgi:hypothetical protein
MAVTLGTTNKNLIGPSNWTAGSGGVAAANGYVAFNANQDVGTENNRYLGTDPWNGSAIVWQTVPSGNGNADGGWNTDTVNIDSSKMYRFSVWVKRTSSTTGGTFYLGTQSSTGAVYNLSGGNSEGNPYWICCNIGQLTQNQWYLVVGHCFPYNYKGNKHADSGIYTILSGKFAEFVGSYACNIPGDCSWQSGTTNTYHRCYHYYCNDSTSRLELYDPRIDLCDGTEPSVSRLLAGPINNATTTGLIFSDGSQNVTNANSLYDSGQFVAMTAYTIAGTYTWTNPGATKVIVKCVGGGGGSSGYCESGGGGGYVEKVINIAGLSTVSVTVGGGGGGVGYYAAATGGGTSSFGSFCSATGGGGANTYSSHSGGHGGVGSGGDVNLTGGSGLGHCNSSGGWTGGQGGPTYFGGGGPQIRNHTHLGAKVDKTYPGAPGSGAPGKMTDGHNCYWPALPDAGDDGCVIIYAYK